MAQFGRTTGRPNFHIEPNATSPAPRFLQLGVRLEVIGTAGDYLQVIDSGQTGWIHKALVDLDPPTADPPTVPVIRGVTTGRPNFHTGPNLESPAPRFLDIGVEVEIIGHEGEYLHVRQGDETGWVHIALVQPLVPGSLPPAPDPRPATTPPAVLERHPFDPSAGFRSAADIDQWFVARTGLGFIPWFQRDHQQRGAWGDRVIAGRRSAEGFSKLFDRIELVFDRPGISLEQFLGLASVVIYETGGEFWPISELVGMRGHPGIAYAFDRIDGLKASYNTGANRTAGSLFRDPAFIGAFDQLPNATDVLNSTDPVWDGEVFPQQFPTDPSAESVLKECDFYKFRGRGFIQTTWRSAYKEIIRFIQNADDPNPVIQKYRAAWANLDPETAATVSTNAQWDELFQDTDCIVACAGIRIHNKGKRDYLGLSSDRGVLAGSDSGSAFNCGRMVNGGTTYANQMRARVLQLRDALMS